MPRVKKQLPDTVLINFLTSYAFLLENQQLTTLYIKSTKVHKYRSLFVPLSMKWVRCSYIAYLTEQIARVSSSNLVVSIISIRVHLSAETQAYLQLTAGMMEVYVLGGRRHFISNLPSLYCIFSYICLLLGWINIFDLLWIRASIVYIIGTYRNNKCTW